MISAHAQETVNFYDCFFMVLCKRGKLLFMGKFKNTEQKYVKVGCKEKLFLYISSVYLFVWEALFCYIFVFFPNNSALFSLSLFNYEKSTLALIMRWYLRAFINPKEISNKIVCVFFSSISFEYKGIRLFKYVFSND